MTGDIAVFIAARLDEDEAAARAWERAPWVERGEEAVHWRDAGSRHVRYENAGETLRVIDVSGRPVMRAEAIQVKWDTDGSRTAHIARHDPARVLREVAAKQAILALHSLKVQKREQYAFDSSTGEPVPDEYDGDCDLCGWFDPGQGACATLRHLAAAWSDHPDYRAGWKP